MDHAVVLAQLAVAQEEVGHVHLLHRRDHRHSVVRAGRLDRLEVVHGRRVDARVDHARHLLHLLEEALGERAVLVVHVPVKAVGQQHALRRVQAQAVDVGDEHQQSGQALVLGDAELVGGLDRVDRVAAGVGEADDLGLGALRLQQERGEVRGVERVAHLSDDLAAGGLDHVGRVGFERVAERVVGGQEEPGVAAGLHDRLARAVGQREGVVGVVDRVRVAVLVGQAGRGGAHVDDQLFLLVGDLAGGDADRGVERVGDHVHLVAVEPLAHAVGARLGVVLVVGRHELDLRAENRLAEVVDRHLRGDGRALPAEVRIQAGHVGEHADLDDTVGNLAGGGLLLRHRDWRERKRRCHHCTDQIAFHVHFLLLNVSACAACCCPDLKRPDIRAACPYSRPARPPRKFLRSGRVP